MEPEYAAEEGYKETKIRGVNGCCSLVSALLLIFLAAAIMTVGGIMEIWPVYIVGPLMVISAFILLSGVMVIQPNQAIVCQFCGKYVGTVRQCGLWFVNPLYTKSSLSLRIHNFETS